MKDYIPYTYLIGWKEHDKWYYGVRFSRNCNPDDLWVKYFTSSCVVKEFREKYGEPDVIEIRQTFNDSLQAREWEHGVLKKLDVTKSDKWLNKSEGKSSPPMFGKDNPFYGRKHTQETKDKIGAKSVGRKHSEEFKAKQSERNSGVMNYFFGSSRIGENNPMFGRKHSESTKEKQRSAKKLNPPVGTKNPMYGKKQPTEACPFCGIVCSKTNIKKWHGDNCKERKI